MRCITNAVRLQEELQDAPVVLFVGAGVTAHLVRPWTPLLDRLLEQAVDSRLGSKFPKHTRDAVKAILAGSADARLAASPYAKAGIVRRLLGRQYLRRLHSLLYADLNRNLRSGQLSRHIMLTSGLLGPVARLCASSRVHAVVTYNFDDLLEHAVRGIGRRVDAVYGGRQSRLAAHSLPFYHVHGFLPWQRKLDERDPPQVVFALEELFGAMLEPFSWQSVTQLFFLRNHVCLFVGASLRDLDMLRMLSHAHSYCLRGTSCCYGLMSRMGIVGKEKEWERGQGDLTIRTWAALLDDFGMRLTLSGDDHESEARYIDELAKYLESRSGDEQPRGRSDA